MLTAFVLVFLGIAFLALSFVTVNARVKVPVARSVLLGACALCGLLVLAAVIRTPLAGELTQTPAISLAWFITSSCFIVSVIVLAAGGIDRLHKRAFSMP